MTSRDALSLSRAGRSIRTFPLGHAPVEVGSHADCEIVVHAPAVPARALLVQPFGGTVYVYDIAACPGLGKRRVMPLGEGIPLGAGYCVTRIKDRTDGPRSSGTVLLDRSDAGLRCVSLIGGAGAEVRAFHVGDEPVSVGSAPGNRILLSDRAVSRHHCRIEPSEQGVAIRDLGSTNGTWVDGARVRRQALRAGAVIRLGRTLLRVAAREAPEVSASGIVVASSEMLRVMADVDRLARLPWPVLIRGETGVGKEHVARALHERGPRREGPFVPLNGGGLARELIESELFGHERGAFTGAVQAHRGAFEQAHRGTLFLDEVAELPADLQTRLLRVLETWRVRRVGGETTRRVDVRLLCATHRDLRAMVRQGRFRADLYYRIHRLVVAVPPLRARRDDVTPLTRHFLLHMQSQIGEREITPDALERLRNHPWPGNVRELRNVLELAAIDCDGAVIGLGAIERSLRRVVEPNEAGPVGDSLREALEHYGGNVAATARALGIPRSTLRDRLRQSS